MSNSGAGYGAPAEPETDERPPAAWVLARLNRAHRSRNAWAAAYVRHGGGGWCEECQTAGCAKSQYQRHVLYDFEVNKGLPSKHDESCPCLAQAPPGAVS